MDQMEV